MFQRKKYFLMSKQLIILLLFLSFLIIATSYYYYWTVPANSIWYDQRAAIEVFQKIIDGQFPLVGYNHSIGIPSFAAFYYITTTLFFLSDPIELYYFTAFINVISILILYCIIIFKIKFIFSYLFGICSALQIFGDYIMVLFFGTLILFHFLWFFFTYHYLLI